MPDQSFNDKLISIQKTLKAPKGQRNNFGNYNYRSCEDILESVKPLCHELGLTLVISDDIQVHGDRIYVKAQARLTDGESEEVAKAFAREPLSRKGMDESQITGATSSYARKYALNGLFAIDDAKDADTKPPINPDEPIGSSQIDAIEKLMEPLTSEELEKFERKVGGHYSLVTQGKYESVVTWLKSKASK